MFSSFRQSIKALRANPGRTALTTLGIIIGIATVILVLSAGQGFRSLIDNQVDTLGTNTLFLQTRVPPTTKNLASGGSSGPQEVLITITTLKNRDLEAIKRVPNVVNTYGMVTGQKVASYKNTAKNVIFYGSSPARFEIDKGTLKSGWFFSESDDAGAAQVAILGSQLAEDLFEQSDPVGKLVRVGELNFQVIGVYNSRGGLGGEEDKAMYIPLQTAQKKLLGIDHLLFAVIQLKDINLGAATAEDVKILLRQNHNITDPAKDDFTVQTQAEALGTFNTIFDGITILLIAIAAISLIVGGVGIMNIMYVVVTERTAEIGLKKALGATNSDILNEFLIESILVTVLGGSIGIVVGSFLGWLVSVIASASGLVWQFAVPLYAILLAVGVSGGIGILFGVLPARQASKLDPIRALQYE